MTAGPAGRPVEALDDRLDVAGPELDDLRERPQRRAQRVGVRRHQRYRVARQVLGDHLAAAVVDHAAVGRERDLAEAVLLRLHHVLAVPQHLRAVEAAAEQYEREQQERPREARPADDVVRVEAHGAARGPGRADDGGARSSAWGPGAAIRR
jgi:hypothetical protein